MRTVECWRDGQGFHVRLPGRADPEEPLATFDLAARRAIEAGMAPFTWRFRDPREVAAEAAPPARAAA